METWPRRRLTRRFILQMGAVLLPTAACSRQSSRSSPHAIAEASPQAASPAASAKSPTPACGEQTSTLAQTAGPFFTPNSPQRSSLREPGLSGTPIILTGSVLTTDCQPIAGALVDFWHADNSGVYDNAGYRLRGHQFTDERGRYQLETIVPGFYPGRTRHFHVKVQAPNQPVLTTQLYFPGEAQNESDQIFNPTLVVGVEDAATGKMATFDFHLAVG